MGARARSLAQVRARGSGPRTSRPQWSSSGTGPTSDPRAIDRVVDAWRRGGDDRVAATYGGVRLHPVLLGRAAWENVPDEGLRGLPAALVPCDDLKSPGDVDFADELEGWPPRKEE
jgi:hypothetical protein